MSSGFFYSRTSCRFCLREHLRLDVAPSTIPDAGRGLFTLFGRVKGDHLIEYLGEVLSGLDVEPATQRVTLVSTVLLFRLLFLSMRLSCVG